ncbi:MAG: hypothetical protein PHC51_02045 [bacterium]|nr:hypothetical protein [bacterium]
MRVSPSTQVSSFHNALALLDKAFMLKDDNRDELSITVENTKKVAETIRELSHTLEERERLALAMTLLTVSKQPDSHFENKRHFIDFLTRDALVALSDNDESTVAMGSAKKKIAETDYRRSVRQ